MTVITGIVHRGERDMAAHPASTDQLHRCWKKSLVLRMKPIGHMPDEQVPREFTRIVLDFLLNMTSATPLQTEASLMAQTTVENRRA
jgi:hypothetical protein